MFITVETIDGGEATINTAFITHVTQIALAYAEGGSVIHFASDRDIQVKMRVEQLTELIEPGAAHPLSDAPLMLHPVR